MSFKHHLQQLPHFGLLHHANTNRLWTFAWVAESPTPQLDSSSIKTLSPAVRLPNPPSTQTDIYLEQIQPTGGSSVAEAAQSQDSNIRQPST